jgi:hypothetical protein
VAGVNGDLIDGYLARLRAGLRTAPARTAEIVDEAEDHLRESVAARRAEGLTEEAAQRAAISAFGPAERISRAHRPAVSAYAAAAALLAWPLVAGYLLLSGLIGALLLWDDHGLVMAPAVAVGGLGTRTIYELGGRARPGPAAATIGGCAAAGALLLTGFLIVRRHRRRSGLVSAPLPQGLFALAAGFALLALGIAENQSVLSYGLGPLSAVTGTYELAVGGLYAAVLTGIGCGVRAMNALATARSGRPEPPPGGGAGHRARRARRSGYAAVIGFGALRILGGYLLLSAMMAGLLGYVDTTRSSPAPPYFGELSILVGGGALGGLVLLAALAAVRNDGRRSGTRPPALPRGLAAAISAGALLALGVAEYLAFSADFAGRPRIPAGPAGLFAGAQWAGAILGTGWALRALSALVSWMLTSRRSRGRQAPPGDGRQAPPEGSLAPAR